MSESKQVNQSNESEYGVSKLIKSRIISLNKEIVDMRTRLADKEHELKLAKTALNAIRTESDKRF